MKRLSIGDIIIIALVGLCVVVIFFSWSQDIGYAASLKYTVLLVTVVTLFVGLIWLLKTNETCKKIVHVIEEILWYAGKPIEMTIGATLGVIISGVVLVGSLLGKTLPFLGKMILYILYITAALLAFLKYYGQFA
jgi:hypothetical protein